VNVGKLSIFDRKPQCGCNLLKLLTPYTHNGTEPYGTTFPEYPSTRKCRLMNAEKRFRGFRGFRGSFCTEKTLAKMTGQG
jgi:hypothetical protein